MHVSNNKSPAANDIYTISRLYREVRTVLEEVFPTVWVQGEISNLAKPASGHLYFSLKDNAAQVRCAMFKNRQSGLRFEPENGMQVMARANELAEDFNDEGLTTWFNETKAKVEWK